MNITDILREHGAAIAGSLLESLMKGGKATDDEELRRLQREYFRQKISQHRRLYGDSGEYEKDLNDDASASERAAKGTVAKRTAHYLGKIKGVSSLPKFPGSSTVMGNVESITKNLFGGKHAKPTSTFLRAVLRR